jgi:hypothetical protein
MSIPRIAILALALMTASPEALASPPDVEAPDVLLVAAVSRSGRGEPFRTVATGRFARGSDAWVANVGPIPSGRRLVVDRVDVAYPSRDYAGWVAPCRLYIVTEPITSGAIDPRTIELRLKVPVSAQRASSEDDSHELAASKPLTLFVDEGRYLASRCDVPTADLAARGTFVVTGYLE